MLLKRYIIWVVFLGFGSTQALLAQKSGKAIYEVRVDAYKMIRDTALVRVQQYKNDTLLQEIYGFKIPSCRINYGLKLGKFKAFKRYESVDVLIPHGKYTQYLGEVRWERVFDRGVLVQENYQTPAGQAQVKPAGVMVLADLLLIDHHRKCKEQERRYFNILLYQD